MRISINQDPRNVPIDTRAPSAQLDAIADLDDRIDIRVVRQLGLVGQTVYVDVNGITMVRIGHITQQVEVFQER